MTKIIHISPSRLVTDPARNPRFAASRDPAAAARAFYDSDEYRGLCRSFAASGIQLPLFVSKRKGNGYTVLEGFSRAHWAKQQAKTDKTLKVPVRVLPSGKDARTAAVAMNTARVAYDPLARAASFASMVEEWGSIEQAAKRSGVSVGAVRESLRLLQLPRRAQKMIYTGKLSVANALKITRLPGWKSWRKMQDGRKVSSLERREGKDFEAHIKTMLEALKGMSDVPDVGGQWNRTVKSREVNTDNIAVVLPTVESVREACHVYGRKIARIYIEEGADPDNAARVLRYRTGIEHLSAAMGWCVPKCLIKTLKSSEGKPLYTESVAEALRREVVNEFVLAGVISLANRENRAFKPNDELLEDENWRNFFRQRVPLEQLVQKLNRRLK